jgi:hypothetical protein
MILWEMVRTDERSKTFDRFNLIKLKNCQVLGKL